MAVVSAGELRNRVEVLRRIGRAKSAGGAEPYDYEAERGYGPKSCPRPGGARPLRETWSGRR